MDGHNSVLHGFGWVQRDRTAPTGAPTGFGQAVDTVREHGKLALFIGQRNLDCENVKSLLFYGAAVISISASSSFPAIGGAATVAGGYKNGFLLHNVKHRV